MRPFAYAQARTTEDALATLARHPHGAFFAGGTNIVDLIKLDVAMPDTLIDINALPLGTIETRPDGTLWIGALARMSDTADHPAVRAAAPAVSRALNLSASPQLRNMASIGGNLMQRTRCAYFRDVSQAVQQAPQRRGLQRAGRRRPPDGDPRGERAVHLHASVRLRGRDAADRCDDPLARPGRCAHRPAARLSPAPRRGPDARHGDRPRRDRRSDRVRPERADAQLGVREGARPRLVRVRPGLGRGGARRARRHDPRRAGRRRRRRARAVAREDRGSRADRASRRRARRISPPPKRSCAAAKPLRLNAFKTTLARNAIVRALGAVGGAA